MKQVYKKGLVFSVLGWLEGGYYLPQKKCIYEETTFVQTNALKNDRTVIKNAKDTNVSIRSQ